MQQYFTITIVLAFCLVLVCALLALCLWKLWHVKRELNRVVLSRKHIQALVDSIPDLTWVKDKNCRFLMVNHQFSKVFNLPIEKILGKTDTDLSQDEAAQRYLEDDREVMATGEAIHREEKVSAPDGKEAWAETVKVPVLNEKGEIVGTAGLARDISERKVAQAHIEHMAHHDALTGLPNRVLLEMQVKRNLIKHEPSRDNMVIMFIDLDNFKVINDTISHKIGDSVLIELANRLRNSLREDDIVARIGGDEFIIALPFTEARKATQLLAPIKELLAQPVKVDNLTFDITMSIGLACYPNDGEDCWTLVQNADLAMYHAKQTGKNQSIFFTQQLADRSIKNMMHDSRIIEALEKNEFELVYQPKISAHDGKIMGFEALMRWHDRLTGQWLLPCEFIPATERTGFIIKLGDWLINQVIRQLAEWYKQGIEIPIAINMSAVQIHQNRIGQKIKHALLRYNVPGRLLELELTESVLMENSEKIIARLQEIRELGVAISIDDFGTGYSNFAYLSRFPLTSLKIDRIFVDGIHNHHNHFQVASAIIEMARSMKLKVVAEGVEQPEELLVMLNMGVDELQGFYFDKPLLASDLADRLLAQFNYYDRFPTKKQPLRM